MWIERPGATQVPKANLRYPILRHARLHNNADIYGNVLRQILHCFHTVVDLFHVRIDLDKWIHWWEKFDDDYPGTRVVGTDVHLNLFHEACSDIVFRNPNWRWEDPWRTHGHPRQPTRCRSDKWRRKAVILQLAGGQLFWRQSQPAQCARRRGGDIPHESVSDHEQPVFPRVEDFWGRPSRRKDDDDWWWQRVNRDDGTWIEHTHSYRGPSDIWAGVDDVQYQTAKNDAQHRISYGCLEEDSSRDWWKKESLDHDQRCLWQGQTRVGVDQEKEIKRELRRDLIKLGWGVYASFWVDRQPL